MINGLVLFLSKPKCCKILCQQPAACFCPPPNMSIKHSVLQHGSNVGSLLAVWRWKAMNRRKESCHFTLCYLNVDARPQKVTHFLQDLLLQSVPGHSAIHVQYKRESKPKRKRNSYICNRKKLQVGMFSFRFKLYLFPWWPLHALLQTRRIIFSGPRFLFGDAVNGVMAPCMNDGVLLISGPYFKWL